MTEKSITIIETIIGKNIIHLTTVVVGSISTIVMSCSRKKNNDKLLVSQ